MNVDRHSDQVMSNCRASASFPLTPTLSLGEREKLCRTKEDLMSSNFIQSLL